MICENALYRVIDLAPNPLIARQMVQRHLLTDLDIAQIFGGKILSFNKWMPYIFIVAKVPRFSGIISRDHTSLNSR